MEVKKTAIDGLLLIEPSVFGDTRGYFFESFSKPKYAEVGIDCEFVQDNISKSTKSTVRGLHYQIGESAQGKLCSVLRGKVIDVAVDIRFGSPTFGEHVAVELSGELKNQFWIPPGFAHGFSVLSEEAIFHYKCSALYDKTSERCIIYNDSTLNIDWQVDNPVISDKDKQGKKFAEIDKNFIF